MPNNTVILVTGPAGAGRSTAIHGFEDMGFEAVDNIPLSLLPRLLSSPPERGLAIGVDARTRGFSPEAVIALVDQLRRKSGIEASLLYLECEEEVLLRRFGETRRKHPMAPEESAKAGVAREVALLGNLREYADLVVDTSDLSPRELQDTLKRSFKAGGDTLSVSVQSFSYKKGVPSGLDMVIDCRFLRNPHWDIELRAKDGREAEVAAYVTADPLYPTFFAKLTDLVALLLPAYRDEGKAYFAIGLGCTGGKHRSVCVAESLANALATRDWRVSIRHNELERMATEMPAPKKDYVK